MSADCSPAHQKLDWTEGIHSTYVPVIRRGLPADAHKSMQTFRPGQALDGRSSAHSSLCTLLYLCCTFRDLALTRPRPTNGGFPALPLQPSSGRLSPFASLSPAAVAGAMTELAARLRTPRGRAAFAALLRSGHFGLNEFGPTMQETQYLIRYEPKLAACLLDDEIMRAVIDGFSRYRPGDSGLPEDWSDDDQVQCGAVRLPPPQPTELYRGCRCT